MTSHGPRTLCNGLETHQTALKSENISNQLTDSLGWVGARDASVSKNCQVHKIFQLWQLVGSHLMQERADIEGKAGRRRRRGEEEKVQGRGEQFA